MQKTLVVIDIQNDYFADGKFPLWQAEETLANIKNAIEKAIHLETPVVFVQHVADSSRGIAPFFNAGTLGVELHRELLPYIHNSKIVQKQYADAFYQTDLESVLTQLGSEELLICGMMTQNCVTHTAISKSAEKYTVCIIPECCASVSEAIHQIALHAVSTRVPLKSVEEVLI